jgi:hypothetical protein
MILRSISTKEKFPRTENFPKMPLLKVESKYFSDGKFVSANHILQNFVSAENLNGPYRPEAFRKMLTSSFPNFEEFL